jgi:hypothetical protein
LEENDSRHNKIKSEGRKQKHNCPPKENTSVVFLIQQYFRCFSLMLFYSSLGLGPAVRLRTTMRLSQSPGGTRWTPGGSPETRRPPEGCPGTKTGLGTRSPWPTSSGRHVALHQITAASYYDGSVLINFRGFLDSYTSQAADQINPNRHCCDPTHMGHTDLELHFSESRYVRKIVKKLLTSNNFF